MIILICPLQVIPKVTRERRTSHMHWLAFYLLQRQDKLKGSPALDLQV